MNIKTPGKLILSGEYAVIHGRPALVMAIPYFVETQLNSYPEPGVMLNGIYKTWETLLDLETQLLHRYQSFIDHQIHIRQVLQSPEELCWFAIIHCLFQTHHVPSGRGVQLSLHTDIPIGCGMGSSAAVIINLMHAMSTYYELNLSKTALYPLALTAEHLQHGHSSGTDLKIVLEGGLRSFQRHHTRLLSTIFPTLQLVHTGKPMHTTGECVTQVNQRYPNQHPIWDDFEHCTRALINNIDKPAIRENHRLLHTLGVVPNKVAQFIETIETQGGAAKICGAGSIGGDSAGIVMVLHDQDITPLCNMFAYTPLTPIHEAACGSIVV